MNSINGSKSEEDYYQTPKSENKIWSTNNNNNQAEKYRKILFITDLPEDSGKEGFVISKNSLPVDGKIQKNIPGIINERQSRVDDESRNLDPKISFVRKDQEKNIQYSDQDSARGHSSSTDLLIQSPCQSLTDQPPSLSSNHILIKSSPSSHSIHSIGSTEGEVSISILESASSNIPQCQQISSINHNLPCNQQQLKLQVDCHSDNLYEEEDTCSCSGSTCTNCTCSDLCSLSSGDQHKFSIDNNNTKQLTESSSSNHCSNCKDSNQEESTFVFISLSIPHLHYKVSLPVISFFSIETFNLKE